MISRDQEHHPASEQATFQDEEIRVLVEQELSHQKDHCRASQELNNSTTPDQPIIQSTRDRALTSPLSDLQANVIQEAPQPLMSQFSSKGMSFMKRCGCLSKWSPVCRLAVCSGLLNTNHLSP
jgi:hypothetical protein